MTTDPSSLETTFTFICFKHVSCDFLFIIVSLIIASSELGVSNRTLSPWSSLFTSQKAGEQKELVKGTRDTSSGPKSADSWDQGER